MTRYGLKTTWKNGNGFLWNVTFLNKKDAVDYALKQFHWIEGANRNVVWKKIKRNFNLSIVKVRLEEIE